MRITRTIVPGGAQVWTIPLDSARKVDRLRGGTRITVLAWAVGRDDQGDGTWFQIGRNAWIWAHDTTDPGTHDLTLNTALRPVLDAENNHPAAAPVVEKE